MSSLPTALYTCDQVKALDQSAIKMLPIAGFELMQKAGKAAFELLRQRWPDENTLTVFCGGGNNAGDGFVVAALAVQAGLNAQVLTVQDPNKLRGDAKSAYQMAVAASVPIAPFVQDHGGVYGLVVDALLGTGISGSVREHYAQAINAINDSKQPVLAIDVPSGICGDTGSTLGCAVKACCTITFIGLKRGLFTGEACGCCGEIIYADLGVSSKVFATQTASCNRLEFLPPLLPPRAINSHKGMFGRVLVIAGDKGFGGAGIMAAESALLSGAGLVYLATQPQHTTAALARRPELMVSEVESSSQLKALLGSANVLIVGPGIGQSEWSHQLVETAFESEQALVVDADGLNLLANKFKHVAPRDNWILTPHPAEAARLLNTTTAKVQADRFAAAQALQQQFGGVIVLKGAGTIVASEHGLYLCSAGNPAMATPGMGDVLSGIIGGLLAQGLSLPNAAKLGVWAHATAADNLKPNKFMLATDVYKTLPELW